MAAVVAVVTSDGGEYGGVLLLPLTLFNIQCSSSPQNTFHTLPTALSWYIESQLKYVCCVYRHAHALTSRTSSHTHIHTHTPTYIVRRYFIAFLFITLYSDVCSNVMCVCGYGERDKEPVLKI